jgi:RNA polymerase sigma-70 factor (ECF subfamily)
MMTNDEQLLAQAKQLDPAALRALHQRFYEPVVRYIQFKVGNPQTVEDLSGEVFVRVLEGLKLGRGWRESPQGWILGIARNVVVDYYRRRERVTEVALNEQITAAENSDPTRQALLSERQSQLVAAIQQLTDEQRDVILMRFMEGIDLKGVAAATNKTVGAIKGLQYRALQTLAEIMGDVSAENAVGTKKWPR